jgi:hypothetical protein
MALYLMKAKIRAARLAAPATWRKSIGVERDQLEMR